MDEGGGQSAVIMPGQALRSELAGRGVTVNSITATRLEGHLIVPGGPVVRYRDGWLVWPAGGPLLSLHRAGDPAGASRRLPHPSRTTAGGGPGSPAPRPGRTLRCPRLHFTGWAAATPVRDAGDLIRRLARAGGSGGSPSWQRS